MNQEDSGTAGIARQEPYDGLTSLIAANQITAVAIGLLALFAIFTTIFAYFAYSAFKAQSD